MSVVVIGAIFLDIKGYPNGKYLPTGRNAGRIEYVYGGVMRNIAEDISNTKEDVTFLTLIDNTELAEDMLTDLQKKHINVDYVDRSRDGMGTWLAVFNEHGDVAGSISKRPNFSSLCKLLDKSGEELFNKNDSVAIVIDEDKDVTYKTIDLAKKCNKKVFAAVSNMSEALKVKPLFKELNLLVCNRIEAEMMFNCSFDNTSIEEKERIIREKVIENNYQNIVITFGELGAIYVDENHNSGYVESIKTNVIDTTGAGDAFFSGVVACLNRGYSLKDACLVGNKMASLTISQIENVCPPVDVKALVE